MKLVIDNLKVFFYVSKTDDILLYCMLYVLSIVNLFL